MFSPCQFHKYVSIGTLNSDLSQSTPYVISIKRFVEVHYLDHHIIQVISRYHVIDGLVNCTMVEPFKMDTTTGTQLKA